MNAASSVLGSVLAIIIAIQFGLNVTLGIRSRGLCVRAPVGDNACVQPTGWRDPAVQSAIILG